MFAYCVNPHLTAIIIMLLPFQRQPSSGVPSRVPIFDPQPIESSRVGSGRAQRLMDGAFVCFG